jgi:hypothetical protein
LGKLPIFFIVAFPQTSNHLKGNYQGVFTQNFKEFGPWSDEIWPFFLRLPFFSSKFENFEKNGLLDRQGPQKRFLNFYFWPKSRKTS